MLNFPLVLRFSNKHQTKTSHLFLFSATGKGHATGHLPGLHHGCEQRDRHSAADRGGGAPLSAAEDFLPHRCGPGRGQNPGRRERAERGPHVHQRPQDLRPQGHRRAVRPKAATGADRGHSERRRTGARHAEWDSAFAALRWAWRCEPPVSRGDGGKGSEGWVQFVRLCVKMEISEKSWSHNQLG